MKEPIKVVAENRKARHDYFIDETYEAGIALVGTEVKSIRTGKVSLRDSYAEVVNGEAYLQNMHISPYDKGSRFNHDPKRPRKLLLHKREIKKLLGQTTQKGYTLIPLRLYFKRGKVKVELALARGKKLYDKRQDIAKRDAQREMARALSSRNRDR
ncbi:MAG TPA: SsrA-binding protein SmpB [Syntrophomonadaceae bacterium]|jgi:SsrA-binding protein|nr:SsrA-binding protein SmpB [Thermoanaerobacterales bacterium]NLN20437.1 SsrA-binding protein SmpB [Syntrophomonadaceae bacterium]HAF17440.1 SsrA-binding protein [Peptococcaceae bacterium]HHW29189.1 SsrA-binding protein SmpB [Syntrophomonadaceae bacterium]